MLISSLQHFLALSTATGPGRDQHANMERLRQFRVVEEVMVIELCWLRCCCPHAGSQGELTRQMEDSTADGGHVCATGGEAASWGPGPHAAGPHIRWVGSALLHKVSAYQQYVVGPAVLPMTGILPTHPVCMSAWAVCI